jgi:signal peptidase II
METALRLYAFSIAAGVFALDRITKLAVNAYISEWDTYTIIPGFFNLIHAENPGAAFSMFAQSPSEWRRFILILVSGAAAVLIATLLWRPGRLGDTRLARTGLALVLGGSTGNLYDRIVHETVTDFLDAYAGTLHWPAFNVADSAITIGVALIILEMVRSHRAARTG